VVATGGIVMLGLVRFMDEDGGAVTGRVCVKAGVGGPDDAGDGDSTTHILTTCEYD